MEKDLTSLVLDCLFSGRNLLEKDSKRYCLLPEHECPNQRESDKKLPLCVNKAFGVAGDGLLRK